MSNNKNNKKSRNMIMGNLFGVKFQIDVDEVSDNIKNAISSNNDDFGFSNDVFLEDKEHDND